jgi:hypothetical protein
MWPVERQIGRRVVEDLVSAPLSFEQNCKRGIAADVDPLDWVHLACNAKAHDRSANAPASTNCTIRARRAIPADRLGSYRSAETMLESCILW